MEFRRVLFRSKVARRDSQRDDKWRFLTMANANDSGQTLVETAISLSIFLLLVLGTIDFGYLISTKVTLQNGVRQGGRYAITGQCITGSDGSCSESRYNSIRSEEHTSELQSLRHLVCRLLLEKKETI